jgi:MFS family permease
MSSATPVSATESTGPGRLKGYQVFAILLIPAVWLIDTTIMAPALGLIAEAFPGASAFWINIVFTIPYVTSIIFSTLSGRLSRRVDKKVLAVVGLVIYGVSGIIPAWTGGLVAIFVLRLLTGIGLGLALPMPNVYIAEFFRGDKREKMLGYANVVAQAANIVVLVICGYLITLGWRYTFYGYALVLIIAAINLFWLPSSRTRLDEPVAPTATASRERLHLSGIIGVAAAMTAVYVVFAIAAANISSFIVNYKVAPVAAIGLIATAPAVGNIIGSFLSERLRKVLKGWLPFTAMVLAGVGFLVYSTAGSALSVIVATGLVGISVGLLTPFLLNVTAQRATARQKGLALGLVSGCINFGVLLFPYVQELIGIAGGTPSQLFVFTVMYVLIFLGAAVTLVVGLVRRPRHVVTAATSAGDRA